ncbi:hypothetical protein AB0B06_30895 [Streptomyces sp. NPDC044989]|uniref:hypothetical protein n=1 Tax=Streptomyces sp. NPDC044989 TaxID=3154336 RepID=UPI0033E5D207
MATQLVRGMGSFFKGCACSRQNRCAHPYAIRYRDAAGRQREEAGYSTHQAALDRLTKVYEEKRTTPRAQAELKREIGKQRFGLRFCLAHPATSLRAGSVRTVNQVLNRHILPVLESRRINTLTATVVDDFIMSMEERSAGLAAQQNAFDTLKKILLDARRRGGITEDLFAGVVPPEYVPRKITIPTLDEIRTLKAASSDGLRLVIDLMSGCGLRNGEAYAANMERMVADNVCRITEQIEGKTRERAPLKHRKLGDFRETPLPATVRDALLRFEKEHGVDTNGYLLRSQRYSYWVVGGSKPAVDRAYHGGAAGLRG